MADEYTTVVHLVGCVCDLCEARAEIERLRDVIRDFKMYAEQDSSEIIRLRRLERLGRYLYIALDSHYGTGSPPPDEYAKWAMACWEETSCG